jgi:sec-independent protein translocase protein TatA
MSVGFWQVALVLLIVLILFGAGKLPRLMGDLAKGIKSFKAGMKDDEPAQAAEPLPPESAALEHGEAKSDEPARH